MHLISLVVSLIMLILVICRIIHQINFRKITRGILDRSGFKSQKIYNESQLIDLPAPVQKYFRYALKEHQPYVVSVRLRHEGFFRTAANNNDMPIVGHQYFFAPEPRFMWKGKTRWFCAYDCFFQDSGSLNVFLFDLFRIIKGKGKTINEAELQRWVAESVWFPTNLLPSERIQWIAIDALKANLIFRHNAIAFQFTVSFNEIGQITSMESKRFMTETKKEIWICRMSDYRQTNQLKIPFEAEAIWRLSSGDFSYATFKLTDVRYIV